MDKSMFGLVLAVIFVVAIIFRMFGLKKRRTEDLQDEENLDDPMEILFFNKVSDGAEKIHFLDISGSSATQNLIVIKNLLQSEKIPYYSEFEKFNALYGGIATSVKFYILDENYDSALELIKKYTEKTLSGITVMPHGA